MYAYQPSTRLIFLMSHPAVPTPSWTKFSSIQTQNEQNYTHDVTFPLFDEGTKIDNLDKISDWLIFKLVLFSIIYIYTLINN